MKRWLLLCSIPSLLHASTWSAWNGIGVGSASGQVSRLNGILVGTASGNTSAWNSLNSPASGGVSGPITLVNHGTARGAESVTVDCTGANFYVAEVSAFAGTGTPTVTDTGSHTYTQIAALSSSDYFVSTFDYYAANVTGANLSFSASGATFPTLTVMCFAGVPSSPTVSAGTGASSCFSSACQPVVTTGVPSLVITSLGRSSSGPMTIDSGFTITDDSSIIGGTAFGLSTAYKIQTSPGTERPTWGGSGATGTAAATIISVH